MSDISFLDWPFFEVRHGELSNRIEQWCDDHLSGTHPSDVDAECRKLVRELGQAGFLKLCVADGGAPPDVRSLAIARETWRTLRPADFAFPGRPGMGLSVAGSEAQRDECCQGRVGEAARHRHDRADAGSCREISRWPRQGRRRLRPRCEKTSISLADLDSTRPALTEKRRRARLACSSSRRYAGPERSRKHRVIAPTPSPPHFDSVRGELIALSEARIA